MGQHFHKCLQSGPSRTANLTVIKPVFYAFPFLTILFLIKSELSEIKVEEAKRKCENHLLQDERLCAHNNPSTLVLGQLSSLNTQIQTQTQI